MCSTNSPMKERKTSFLSGEVVDPLKPQPLQAAFVIIVDRSNSCYFHPSPSLRSFSS